MLLVLGFAVIEVTYLFIVSAGRFTDWPTYLTFLDDQAEGFRAGHLHFAIEPAAALLAKANPFDPAWKPLWYWDASLYNGHYYLYWGPVPALLLAGFKTLCRVHTRVGDQYVVFALTSLQALAGLLLIDRAHRRLFPALPGVFVVLAVAVFAFVNPTLYNLARAGVYEAAIVGGHAFLVTGLLFAFHAVTSAGRRHRGCTWPWPASAGRWRSAVARRSRPPSCCSSRRPAGWRIRALTPIAGGAGRARSPGWARRWRSASPACWRTTSSGSTPGSTSAGTTS